jgi:hypothetical protein
MRTPEIKIITLWNSCEYAWWNRDELEFLFAFPTAPNERLMCEEKKSVLMSLSSKCKLTTKLKGSVEKEMISNALRGRREALSEKKTPQDWTIETLSGETLALPFLFVFFLLELREEMAETKRNAATKSCDRESFSRSLRRLDCAYRSEAIAEI